MRRVSLPYFVFMLSTTELLSHNSCLSLSCYSFCGKMGIVILCPRKGNYTSVFLFFSLLSFFLYHKLFNRYPRVCVTSVCCNHMPVSLIWSSYQSLTELRPILIFVFSFSCLFTHIIVYLYILYIWPWCICEYMHICTHLCRFAHISLNTVWLYICNFLIIRVIGLLIVAVFALFSF